LHLFNSLFGSYLEDSHSPPSDTSCNRCSVAITKTYTR
jgi:hypothetical protein